LVLVGFLATAVYFLHFGLLFDCFTYAHYFVALSVRILLLIVLSILFALLMYLHVLTPYCFVALIVLRTSFARSLCSLFGCMFYPCHYSCCALMFQLSARVFALLKHSQVFLSHPPCLALIASTKCVH
jgi:hypothetical protein